MAFAVRKIGTDFGNDIMYIYGGALQFFQTHYQVRIYHIKECKDTVVLQISFRMFLT